MLCQMVASLKFSLSTTQSMLITGLPMGTSGPMLEESEFIFFRVRN